jgi:hypothetical protein
MKLRSIFGFIIFLVIMLAFILYDTYMIEETFADNIYDAKVNSLYVHDENNNVRQVTFDVNVPLNRYYVATPTPGVDDSGSNTDATTTPTPGAFGFPTGMGYSGF